MSYTSEDVRREADAYREWARQRDREQFLDTVTRKLKAYNELKDFNAEAIPNDTHGIQDACGRA